MTEDQIEARAERAMDRLDRRLMAGEITQAEYEAAVAAIDRAASAAHRIAPDLIDSLDEARDIVRGLIPGAEHQEAEAIAWSLWQRAASGGWRA